MPLNRKFNIMVWCVMLHVGVMLAAWTQGPAPVPWYRDALVGLEVGPTGAQWGSDPRDVAYASRFNGREIVEAARKAGAEYLVLWARDGEWAYYDSKLMPKCPGLGDRDPLREAAESARKEKFPLIAYCVVQGGGWALREHPEWGMRDAAGNPIEGRFCLNSPYLQFVLGLLDEMAAYGIDGFHVDMLEQGFGPPYGCWCDHCRAQFAAMFPGEEMPRGLTWDASWERMLEFRYRTSEKFERAVVEHVRRNHPGMSVDFNYHGYPPFSFEIGQLPTRHAAIGDFATCETGTWGFSPLAVSLTAEFMRTAANGKPWQVVMQRGTRMYHDQTNRPLNDLRWEMFTLLSHGAQVTIVDKTPFEGQLDPVAWRHYGLLFEEARRFRDLFRGEPVWDVGLYFSSRTRDWWAREDKDRYFTSFYGAHKAMVYDHLTWGVVLDETLDLENLRKFPVLVLSDVAVLSDQEKEILTSYAREGGSLVVTGVTGCYDRYGNRRERRALEELIGAEVKEVINARDNYFQLDATLGETGITLRGIEPDWPHLAYGPAVAYVPRDAQAFGSLRKGIRTTRMLAGLESTDFPYPAGESAGPAVLVRSLGKGRVITLAVSPGYASGSEYRAPEPRLLLAAVVRAARGKFPVEVAAPSCVESCVVRMAPDRFRVHMVGYAAPPAGTDPRRPWILPEMMTDPPRFRARITTDRPVQSFSASRPGTRVEQTAEGLQVEAEDVFESVEITLKATP